MEIVQKKGSNKHRFFFKDELFNFAYENKSGSGDIDVAYADLPQKSQIVIERNEWLRNVGILWLALGVLQIGYAIYSHAPLTGKGFWILLGIISLLWFQFTKVKYSVFQTNEGNVFVIQGREHSQIVAELMSRRKAQLLHLYGDVDLDNDPIKEAAKFTWLRDQGVLSKEEADLKISQLKSVARLESGEPEDKLH